MSPAQGFASGGGESRDAGGNPFLAITHLQHFPDIRSFKHDEVQNRSFGSLPRHGPSCLIAVLETDLMSNFSRASTETPRSTGLHPYDAAAPLADHAFANLAATLNLRLPGSATIEHIGARAIPGSLTKGDLDICILVEAKDFPAAEAILASMYGRNTGSIQTGFFAAFCKDDAHPPVGIQLVERGSELDVFVAFRDALRADAALVEAYNAIKKQHIVGDADAYRAAKSTFIASVLAKRAIS